jgi:hypothetical protein
MRLAVNRRDAGVADEEVDQRDDARRVEEDRAPFGERPVDGQRQALPLVAAVDPFEHRLGAPVPVGKVASLVFASAGERQARGVWMRRGDLAAVDDADLVGRGQNSQRLACVCIRNRSAARKGLLRF